MCQAPPNVTNAVIINQSGNGTTYIGNDTVEYSCKDKTFQMEGNSTATCLYSGHWSQSMKCTKQSNSLENPFFIVLPLFTFPPVMIIGIPVQLFRNRTYDAFVCYDFDGDNEFVITSILPELEEKCDPPFRLSFHSRDFTPGYHIKSNIQEAIESSNSAIIVDICCHLLTVFGARKSLQIVT